MTVRFETLVEQVRDLAGVVAADDATGVVEDKDGFVADVAGRWI